MGKENFFPKMGDVLEIDGKRYVLFDTDVNVPAYSEGKRFFKALYYFLAETEITDPHVTERDLHKKCMTVNKMRDEGFPIECKTDARYLIKECRSLIFKKKK